MSCTVAGMATPKDTVSRQDATARPCNFRSPLPDRLAGSALGAYHRRLCSRMDKPKPVTAVAHKLARQIYAMLTKEERYNSTQESRSTLAKVNRVALVARRKRSTTSLLLEARSSSESVLIYKWVTNRSSDSTQWNGDSSAPGASADGTSPVRAEPAARLGVSVCDCPDPPIVDYAARSLWPQHSDLQLCDPVYAIVYE
jgi:hypothetical protein